MDKEDIEILRESGTKLAEVMEELSGMVEPGVTAYEIDEKAHKLFERKGGKPAFFNFQPKGAKRPFPGAVCVSVNEEVVHGIPNESPRNFRKGDIVSLDGGLEYKGVYTDMATSVGAGEVDEKRKKLMNLTRNALHKGIEAAVAGNSVYHIGKAVEDCVEGSGFGLVKVLGGHGLGETVHEPPFIPNYADDRFDYLLEDGMVLAIEPMLTEGSEKVYVDRDGWTFKTRDGGRSAHFEHTIIIGPHGPEIISKTA